MVNYTVFDRYGSVDDANIVFLFNRKAEAEEMCRHINGEMIRGKFADSQDYQMRFKQEDIRRKILHYIEWTNNTSRNKFYLDGMEWKREQVDDDIYDDIYDDDLEEGMKKKSFNDMVCKQRNKNNNVRKRASRYGYKHLHFEKDYKNISHEEIIQRLKNADFVEYLSTARDFIHYINEDMWTVEGNRYYLIPNNDDDCVFKIRMYDGTLIYSDDISEKTPIELSQIMRGVVELEYATGIYKDAYVEIDDDYYGSEGELLYFFYV